MNGIWLIERGGGMVRPKSKKQVKEAVKSNPESVLVEVIRFGQEQIVAVTNPDIQGEDLSFIGPDPHTDRVFYGVIRPRWGAVVVK